MKTMILVNTKPLADIIRETVKEVPAAPVEVVEEKPETPMERMARLKKERAAQNGGK